MDNFLANEVRKGLEQASKRAQLSSNRLCVHAGDQVHRMTQSFENGFSLPSTVGLDLRGLVDVYDGPKHLYQCLIVCAEQVGDAVHYEFKRMTDAHEQPPADFVRVEEAPIALLSS